MVAAWSVDRLGRSLQDLIATLNELKAKPFHPKASRPVDLSVNRHPDPLGRPPEGGDGMA